MGKGKLAAFHLLRHKDYPSTLGHMSAASLDIYLGSLQVDPRYHKIHVLAEMPFVRFHKRRHLARCFGLPEVQYSGICWSTSLTLQSVPRIDQGHRCPLGQRNLD